MHTLHTVAIRITTNDKPSVRSNGETLGDYCKTYCYVSSYTYGASGATCASKGLRVTQWPIVSIRITTNDKMTVRSLTKRLGQSFNTYMPVS